MDSTGGMLGSDIYTAEFDNDVFDNCAVKNRWVPFTGRHLTKDPMPFPEEDKCQDDASWNLVPCKRDTHEGRVILEVSHPLEASTLQDRIVLPGEQPVLHAYGKDLSYHRKYRGSKRIVLFNSDGILPEVSASPKSIPADATEVHTITATNYSLPSSESAYACTTKYFPIPKGEKRYLAALDVILDPPKFEKRGTDYDIFVPR